MEGPIAGLELLGTYVGVSKGGLARVRVVSEDGTETVTLEVPHASVRPVAV